MLKQLKELSDLLDEIPNENLKILIGDKLLDIFKELPREIVMNETFFCPTCRLDKPSEGKKIKKTNAGKKRAMCSDCHSKRKKSKR